MLDPEYRLLRKLPQNKGSHAAVRIPLPYGSTKLCPVGGKRVVRDSRV